MYSINEWIAGSVLIPSNKVAETRRKIRQLHNEIMDQAYEEMIRFRKANPTESIRKWRDSIQRAGVAIVNANHPAPRIALETLNTFEKPRAGKRKDLDGPVYFTPKVTTDIFPIFWNDGSVVGRIVFDGRKMTWFLCGVPMFAPGYFVNINAFSHSFYGRRFNKILSEIEWVRGSGGGEMRHEGSELDDVDEGLVHRRFFGPNGHTYDITNEPELIKDFIKDVEEMERP